MESFFDINFAASIEALKKKKNKKVENKKKWLKSEEKS